MILENEIHDYVDAGFRIFPLWPIVDNKCSCQIETCDQAGKHPSISAWSQIPEWSDEQLEIMIEHQCTTGFGVLVNGHFIIDIDPRNGGNESFEKLCKDLSLDLTAECNFIVYTGGNGRHLYFSLDDKTTAYSQHLNDYKGLDFKTSGYVVGYGSLHASGKKYTCPDGIPHTINTAPQALLDLLKKPDTHRTEYKGTHLDVTDSDIVELLSFVDPDCDHETWIRCGMAVHHATQGGGLSIWNDWSERGSKYPDFENLQRRWHSFGKSTSPVTIGTLLHYATENGYIAPVTFDTPIHIEKKTLTPFDVGNVDLLRPPGIVGDITKWINEQCRYPRERLAVASALTAMGNIAGLKYTDDKDDISLNLLCLCVAGSATGKEAILQSTIEIHKAIKLQSAIVGNIKSEQEIVRNLIRNQAAYYLIDEVGYLLQKIESARKKGGAAYLDGVIATIMAAYSKADGTFLISGDLKDSVRAELKKELAQCKSKVEDNEDKHGYYERRAKSIEDQALPEIDLGLQRPFLSMMGMTTPISFDGLVTAEQATNGFIGRCLLVREPETNPKRKKNFKRTSKALPDHLKTSLGQIYDAGNFDMNDPMRIEFYGNKISIPSEDAAIDMLEDAADWLEEKAEAQKGETGLEAIVRRSYEQMAKISTILAIGEGLRTTEHVRWAFSMMVQDMDAKLALAQTNIMEGTDEALKNRILDAAGEGESMGTILQRVCRSRKYKKEDAILMIEKLKSSGILDELEVTNPTNGVITYRYASC